VSADGGLRVPPLNTALCRLDRAWDAYFTFEEDGEDA